ncbi:DUF2612 domain-containing protein [Acinetobacter sp. HY1485]|uniref:DUF2612 domain-containing protein n=1 Tax=Acinetobacter sp. HY1485 TaxID=2970918 RepID=UPI0022B95BB7|nr:DUF2612 domain-containing protein [Acinetobacter sp. HY1485]
MANEYTNLITSQYKNSPHFIANLIAVTNPIIDIQNFLKDLNSYYDLDTATNDRLKTIAYWVNAPLLISGAVQLGFFGFDTQESALTFGEIGEPDIGGYFREIGQDGTSGLTPSGEFLRQLIKAQILKNNSTGHIKDTKKILSLVLGHELFSIVDNQNMTVTFKFNTDYSSVQKILVQMFFPIPVGVSLLFGD